MHVHLFNSCVHFALKINNIVYIGENLNVSRNNNIVYIYDVVYKSIATTCKVYIYK